MPATYGAIAGMARSYRVPFPNAWHINRNESRANEY